MNEELLTRLVVALEKIADAITANKEPSAAKETPFPWSRVDKRLRNAERDRRALEGKPLTCEGLIRLGQNEILSWRNVGFSCLEGIRPIMYEMGFGEEWDRA
jgi:hypothetical protein